MPSDYEKRDTGRIPESVGTPLDMVFVQTLAGPDADPYPDEGDEPTTYYCGIMKGVTFDKEVGTPTLDGELTSRRDYVYNLCSGSYIEEDSIVAAFVKNGRLWTMDAVKPAELITFSEDASVAANPSLSRYKGATGALVGSRVLTSTQTYDIGTMRSDRSGNVYYVVHDLQGGTQGALYLRKTNKRCVQQWSVTLHADGDTIGTYADCEVTPDGKVYALTNGTLNGPVSTDEIDPLTYYVAKVAEYDTDGNAVDSWEVQTDAGGANIEASTAEATALAVRADGKIAVGVNIDNYGPVGFGGTITRSKSELQLANADGTSSWRYTFEAITGAHTAGSPRGIACGTDGAVFCVRTASGGGHFVSKLSAAGSLVWDKSVTDYAASVAVTSFNRSICVDGDGNLYVGARQSSDTKFYTLKINGSTGAYVWHHETSNTSFMTPFNDRGSRLAVRGNHVWAVNPTQAGGASSVPTLYKLERSTGAEAAAVNTIRSETACTIAPGRWPLFEA